MRKAASARSAPISAVLAAALSAAAACGGVVSGSAPAPIRSAPILLESGPVSPADERDAQTLYERAGSARDQGAVDEGIALASRIVDRYPRTSVSGDGAWRLASLLAERGRSEEADAMAERYARALPPGDRRALEVRAFQAEVLEDLGDPVGALDRLLRLPPEMTDDEREPFLEHVGELVAEVPGRELGRVLQATPLGQPLAAPVMLAYARTLLLGGESDEASRFARAALEAGASGPVREAAQAIADGRAPEAGSDRPVIGAVLPLSGSPTLRRFALAVEEGIQAAVSAQGAQESVEIDVRDDGGDPGSSAARTEELESDGAVGVVGPLLGEAVDAAAAVRRSRLALVSPSAPSLPDAPSVYSLGKVDPGAVRELARYAAGVGLLQVVIVHSTQPVSQEEADRFALEFTELGGSVIRQMAYAEGATYFRAEMNATRNLRPQALVAPIPAADVPGFAPQVTYFGLDSLGIRVLGTRGWASEEALREVAPRHVNGVVVATPQAPEGPSPGYERFVQAYEDTFSRSVTDHAAAVGYDAASLMLMAVQSGARSAAEVARALEEIRGFPGATGTLSVSDGRVVRDHHLACVQDGRLVPMSADATSVPLPRLIAPSATGGPATEGAFAGMSCPGYGATAGQMPGRSELGRQQKRFEAPHRAVR